MSSLGSTGPAQAGQGLRPTLSGHVPPLAEAYVPRPETGLSLDASLPYGQTIVLAPADSPATRELAGLGGTGKTHLAAALARMHGHNRSAQLIVWVTATGRDAVLTGYAQALRAAGGSVPDESPKRAASRFLAWLATTDRPWLVVLDDLGDAAVLDGLWPAGPAGRVLVTAERPDVAARAPHPRVCALGAFSAREALAYLSARLSADHDQRIGAVDLATDMALLPVTLGLAAAVVTETGMDCRRYRALFADRRQRTSATGAHASIAAAAWSLSAELADQLPPTGLAHRALALASVLAPQGIPGEVLTSQAARAYLTAQRGGPPADDAEAHAVLQNLARAGLATVDTGNTARTVRVHAMVQAVTRQSLPGEEHGHAVRAAADALAQTWSRAVMTPALAQALRDGAARLRELAGSLLWTPQCHPVLLQAGRSLDDSGLAGPAVGYWQAMADASSRVLGPEHPQTLAARASLARYHGAGRAQDATSLAERNLADAYRAAGRPKDAAGRPKDAVAQCKRALADSERTLGPDHPDTIAARARLASAYVPANKLGSAIREYKHAIADCERVLGPDHPLTRTTRENLDAADRHARSAWVHR